MVPECWKWKRLLHITLFIHFVFFCWPAPDKKIINNNETKTITPCQYEKGVGHFNQTFSQQKNSGSYWEWISDQPVCLIVDYVHLLESFQHIKPVTILFVGDSLDHRSVLDLCNAMPSFMSPKLERDDGMVNKARGSHNIHCSNGALTVAYFNIHGMKQSCNNKGQLGADESRVHNTTAQRIENLLAHDILDGVEELFGEGPVVAIIGSCLWDLSQGCNYSPSMDPIFLDDYTRGIMDNHKALKAAGVDTIFWRTCPPVTKFYSDQNEKIGAGRTRTNQKMLNQRLVEVVANESIGTVVDWWSMISDHVPEEDIDMRDGRHYGTGPTLAFVNMFLNTLFYYHESLFPQGTFNI